MPPLARPYHCFPRDVTMLRTVPGVEPTSTDDHPSDGARAGRRAVWLQRHAYIHDDPCCFGTDRSSFQITFAHLRCSLTSCVRRVSIVVVSPPGVLA